MQPSSNSNSPPIRFNLHARDFLSALTKVHVYLQPVRNNEIDKVIYSLKIISLPSEEFINVQLADETLKFDKQSVQRAIAVYIAENAKEFEGIPPLSITQFFHKILYGHKAAAKPNEADVKEDPVLAEKKARLEKFFLDVRTAANEARKKHKSLLEAIPANYYATNDDVNLMEKRVAHIHGDLFVRATGLEGGNRLEMIKYFLEMTQAKLAVLGKSGSKNNTDVEQFTAFRNKLALGLKATELLETAQKQRDSKEFIQEITKQIKLLKPGESLIVGGGWVVPTGAHAVYFEVERTKNEYTLKVYNTGAGIEKYHPSNEDVIPSTDSKKPVVVKKYAPYILIKDIPSERMLAPVFWQTFREMNVIFNNETPKDNDPAGCLYESLLVFLTGKWNNETVPVQDYVLPQHSGICSYAGLLAALSVHLSKPAYERFVHDIQLGSLNEFYERVAQSVQIKRLAQNERRQNLLLKSAIQLASNANERFQKKIISLIELEQVNALAATIKINVAAAQKLAAYERELMSPLVQISCTQTSHYSENSPMVAIDVGNAKSPKDVTVLPLPILPITFKWDARTVVGQLNGWYKELQGALQSSLGQHSQSVAKQALYYVDHIISSLPIPVRDSKDDFWFDIPSTEVSACMQVILDFSELIYVLSFKQQTVTSSALRENLILGLYKCLAIQHRMAAFSAVLQQYNYSRWNINHDLLQKFADQKTSNDSQIYEYRMHVQMEKIVAYFSNQNGEKFINFHGYLDIRSMHRVKNVARENSEEQFALKFYENHPELREKIDPQHRLAHLNVDDCNLYATCLLRDMNGDFLPKEFCTLKKQVFITESFCRLLSTLEHINTSNHIEWNKVIGFEYEFVCFVKSKRIEQELRPFYSKGWLQKQEYTFADDSDADDSDVLKHTAEAPLERSKLSHNAATLGIWVTPMMEADDVPQELQIIKLLDSFSSRLLDLCAVDQQRFFRRVLFDKNCLRTLITKNPNVGKRLGDFIKQSFVFFYERNQVVGQVFMIYMQQMLLERDFEPLSKEIASTVLDVRFRDTESLLLHMLTTVKDTDLRALINRQLLFQYAQEFPALSEKEISSKIFQIISALSFREAWSLPRDFYNSHIDNLIDRLAKIYIQPYLREIFSTEEQAKDSSGTAFKTVKLHARLTELVSAIAVSMGFITKIDWNKVLWTNESGIYQGSVDNKPVCRFNSMTLQLFVAGNTIGRLPNTLLYNSLYQKSLRNFVPLHVEVSADNKYSFLDSNGLKVIVHNAYPITLLRQLKHNGPMFKLLKEPPFKAVHQTLASLTCCQSEDPKAEYPLVFIDDFLNIVYMAKPQVEPGTQKDSVAVDQVLNSADEKLKNEATALPVSASHESQNDELDPMFYDTKKPVINSKYIVVLAKNPDLILLPIENSSSLAVSLSKFEPLEHINIYGQIDKKSGEVIPKVIEMPRLELRFHVERNNNNVYVAMCDQITGFQIAQDQHISSLGSLEGYLVLERYKNTNEPPEIKVIFKRTFIYTEPRGGLTATISFASQPDKGGKSLPPYYEYTLNALGQLTAPKESANLYLAYVLLAQGRYKEAQIQIREKSHALKRYTPRELQILTWMSKLKDFEDNDPRLNAVYLTAISLCLKNQLIFGKAEDHKNFNEEYLAYLASIGSLSNLMLSVDEELTLLKILLKKKKNVVFEKRQSMLMGQWVASSQQLTNVHISSFPSLDVSLRAPGYRQPFQEWRIGSDSLLDMAKPSYYKLYELASTVSGDNRTDFLHSIELMLLLNKKQDSAKYYAFLIGVAYDSENFPSEEAVLAPRNIPNDYYLSLARRNYQKYLVKRSPAIYSIEDSKSMYMSFKVVNESEVKKYLNEIAATESISKINLNIPIFFETSSKLNLSISSSLPKSILPKTKRIRQAALDLFEESKARNDNLMAAEMLLKELSKTSSRTESDTKTDHAYRPAALFAAKQKELVDDLAHFAAEEKSKKSIQFKEVKNALALINKIGLVQAKIDADVVGLKHDAILLHDQTLDLANRLPDLMTEEQRKINAMHQADLLSNKKEPFNLYSLALYFVSERNLEQFQEINPFLTQDDISKLKMMVSSCLYHSIEVQALTRQKEALQAIKDYIENIPEFSNKLQELDEDPIFQDLTNRAFQEFTAKCEYDPNKDFHLLLFESMDDKSLRKDQVVDLQRLSGSSNLVLQKIMGSGKSKVLLPILALTLAKDSYLPIIIVPEALFESTSQDLKQTLGKVFKRLIHSLTFARDSEFTVDKLRDLYGHIQYVHKNRECLIMTNKSIACLALKFREACLMLINKPDDNELLKKVQLLNDILRLFKNSGKAIIDEVDLILNAQVEVSYTLGNTEKVKAVYRQMTSDLYSCLCDPQIQSLFGVNLLDHCTISSSDFQQKVKSALLTVYLDKITKDPNHLLSKWLKTLDDANTKLVMNFLLNKGTEAVDKFVAQINDTDIKNCLALLKEELNELLPLTLSKRFCVDYGRSQKRTFDKARIAIPFSSNNTPVETSEFRSWVTQMNYAMQMWWHDGISAVEIEHRLKALLLEVQKEQKQGASLEKTTSYKLFKELCGKELQDINLFSFTAEDCKLIAKRLNDARKSDPKLFFDFISDRFLSEIKFYESQLVCNAIDFANLFSSSIAFTGTPWNSDSYKQALRAVTERAKGTDGKSLALLYKHSLQSEGMRLLPKFEYPKGLDALIKPSDAALIDVGAIFNGHAHEEVATNILLLLIARESPLKGVIFFKKNRPMMREIMPDGKLRSIPLQQSQLKPEERFTYYDHAHTTGIDIRQALNAQATITIGKEVKVRDLTQGAWRMRGLADQQTVSLALTSELNNRICTRFNVKEGQINFINLLHYLDTNQQEQQLVHILSSLQQKFSATLREAVQDKVSWQLNDMTIAEAAKLMKDVQHIISERVDQSPFANYGKTEKQVLVTTLLVHLENTIIEKIQKIPSESVLFKGSNNRQQDFIGLIRKNIQRELGDIVSLLPSHISSQALETAAAEATAEREQETEKEVATEKERELQRMGQVYQANSRCDHMDNWWRTRTDVAPDIFHASRYFGNTRSVGMQSNELNKVSSANLLSKFVKLFTDVLISNNRMPYNVQGNFLALEQIPTQYVLYVRDPASNRFRVQLLDAVSDFGFFWNALTFDRRGVYPTKERSVQLCVANLDGAIIQQDKSIDVNNPNDPFVKAYNSGAMELRVQLKLIFGVIYFDDSEIPYVQAVIKNMGSALIRDYYQRVVLPQDTEKQAHFSGSVLYKLLN